MKQSAAIVFSSLDGTEWVAVKPEDVPEWLKDPHIMGRLLQGEIAQHMHGNLALPLHLGAHLWYRAERVERLNIDDIARLH
jgi:hypothetical protein